MSDNTITHILSEFLESDVRWTAYKVRNAHKKAFGNCEAEHHVRDPNIKCKHTVKVK